MSIDARVFFEKFLTPDRPPVLLSLKDVSEEGVVSWDISVMVYNESTNGFRMKFYYVDNPEHHLLWDIQSGTYQIVGVTLRRTVFGPETIIAISDGD